MNTTSNSSVRDGSDVEPHAEKQYLDMVKDVIENGSRRSDRTSVGTRSKFGTSMRFDLRKGFPLFTTKKVFWRGVVEELLWFISGSTDANVLKEKGVNIWNGHGSRDFLDSVGLAHREEMDLGPVYGFQWRHFGAEYGTSRGDYSGKGIDQLAGIVNKIKNDPTDRRLILTAWNPSSLREMALPPCHLLCQFYVSNGELSCQLYQRSADLGLGVPFNVASYALLTHIVAHVCGLGVGEFVHVMGDCHVYENHVDPLKSQIEKEPRQFPSLKINPEKKDIDSFEFGDFELSGYDPHDTIRMPMAL